ncbi:MAG: DUF2157 domain-containing protein [Acidimicrobiia bacterium]
MLNVSVLLVVVVVLVVWYVVTRRAPRVEHAPGRAAVPGPSEVATAGGPVDLALRVHEWVDAGLLTPAQADAILAHEGAVAVPAAPAVAAAVPAPPHVRPAGPSRVPVVAEALGYLGGVLAVIGLVLIVSRYWPDMATAGRMALTGLGALALVGAGALVREAEDPAFARLRWFLWLASTACAAVFAAVLAGDAFTVARPTEVMIVATVVAVESGLLWWWRDRPLQQFTCLAGTLVAIGAAVAVLTVAGVVGIAVWLAGVALLTAALVRFGPRPVLTLLVGAIAVMVAGSITASEWEAFGLVFATASAIALVALALVPDLVRDRSQQLVLASVGAVAVLSFLPGTLGYFAREAGVVTGLLTWAFGAGLVVLGARRLVRQPVLVEVLGGLALLGGAALTGVQAPGFAALFGIATAVALVALGTIPGQVLLSVFGSIGLLVNVPWAIGWFFPGEGRAPLLLMVSGALVLVVAVLMARMGGRFRRELGRRQDGNRDRQVPPSSRAAPGPA